MRDFLVLAVVFQFKHFVADFPFQLQYMLKKGNREGWILPLLMHASIHGLITLLLVLVVRKELWWLFLVDIVVHFTVDRIKASPNLLNKFTPESKFFWWTFGADQTAHHITHYFIIYTLLT